jgi:hypothetical protein
MSDDDRRSVFWELFVLRRRNIYGANRETQCFEFSRLSTFGLQVRKAIHMVPPSGTRKRVRL